tara:strand:- start:49 stop:645 length:597 start_codon:yes stop_codon:yes gene_type:complete
MALTKVIGEGIAGISNSSDATVLTLGSNEDVTLNAGSIVFAGSGKGVHLGVTSATASNLIDDYEEGTWTPVWSATAGGSVNAYGAQVGVYTKVGNMVHLACYMATSDKGSISGTLSVAGLPFASEDRTSLYQSGAIWMNTTVDGSDFDGEFHIQIYIAPNNDKIAMQSLDGDGGTAQLTQTAITTNTDLMINISYRAA